MKRLFSYFIFIGCLSLTWGRQISSDPSSLSELEKEKNNNVTDSTNNQNQFSMDRISHGPQKDETSPFRFHGRRKFQAPKHKHDRSKNIGLSAFEEPPPRPRKRNLPPSPPPPYLNRGFNIYRYADSAKKYLVPPHSQKLFPAKHFDRKPFHNGFGGNNISPIDKNLRPPFPPKVNNSTADETNQINGEASEAIKIFQSYSNGGRRARYQNHRHNSKFCSACNSVPWIPLIKVPSSYREEKSQHFEVHKPNLNNNFDSSPLNSGSGFLNIGPTISSYDFWGGGPTSSSLDFVNSGPQSSSHDFFGSGLKSSSQDLLSNVPTISLHDFLSGVKSSSQDLLSSGPTVSSHDFLSSGVKSSSHNLLSSGVKSSSHDLLSSGVKSSSHDLLSSGPTVSSHDFLSSGVKSSSHSLLSNGPTVSSHNLLSSGVKSSSHDLLSSGVKSSSHDLLSSGPTVSSHDFLSSGVKSSSHNLLSNGPTVSSHDFLSSGVKSSSHNLLNSGSTSSSYNFFNSGLKSSSHGFLSNGPKNSAHDFLLPPIPALPSPQYVLDGTISSSYGLPVGNIPISHGLLAPLNHLATKFNRYGANSIDYSNSLSYYNPQNILNNNNAFRALSPVPIAPIYDSGQFHPEPFFNNPVTKILPPTTKTLAVSNVFLTFSEGNQGNLNVPYQGNSGAAFGSNQGTIVDLHPPPPENIQKPLIQTENHQLQNTGAEGFEIVQSVPIAEFLVNGNDFAPQPGIQHTQQNYQSSSYSQGSLHQNENHHHQISDSSEQSQSSESTESDPSNYLVPPPIDYYYNSSLNEVFPPYPPEGKQNTKQGPLHASPSETKTMVSGPTPSWIFSDGQANINPTTYPTLFESQVSINPPAHSTLLEPQANVISTPLPSMLFESHASINPTSHPTLVESQTSVHPTAHPLLSESQAIASIVNNQLYPELSKPLQITSPEAQNTEGSKGKKIQIIIPYTTKSKSDIMEPSGVESVRYEVLESPSGKLTRQTNITDNLLFTTLNPLKTEYFSSKNISSTRQEIFAPTVTPSNYKTINTKGGSDERSGNDTYYSETQHIIASNVRQLLLNEVENVKSNQNFPLQRNIDNWTALEYSNHKVYENKQPEKIITQALAVTTIPGTSISHLLLPSKKIPSEYFATTDSPVYEDTPNFLYEIVNSTVNSSPFTARPYATTNFYSPFSSITKESASDYHQPTENQRSTTLNYNNNYTVVGKSRVSTWNKLNENLFVPTARTSGRIEETSLPVFTNRLSRGSTKSEKVEVVTPVYWANAKNFTEIPFRRTTRHLTTTVRSTFPETQKAPTQRPKIFPFKSRLRTTLLKSVNSTKLEKVSKGKGFNETSSNNITKSNNRTEGAKQGNRENLNKTITVHESLSSFNVSPVAASALLRNISSEEVIKLLKTNKSEEFSINDIFPFRNQELPWESNSLNASNPSSQNERQRKSLIKQTILGKPKTAT